MRRIAKECEDVGSDDVSLTARCCWQVPKRTGDATGARFVVR